MPRIDPFLDVLLSRRGSALHLAAGQPPMIRCSGELVQIRARPVDTAELEALVFEVVTGSDRKNLEEDYEVELAFFYGDKARIRAKCFQSHWGLRAVFSVVPLALRSVDDLGCPRSLKRLCDARSGLVLVAGCPGSGRSTTLAALTDHVNESRACHIVVVGDCAEHRHDPKKALVTHRSPSARDGSFASALRSAAREDADVVVATSLTTPESIAIAVDLAGRGRLVLGAVDAIGAAGAIHRAVGALPGDPESARALLAERLTGVVAQELVRAADGKSRTAAFEVLVVTKAVAALIRDNKLRDLPRAMRDGKEEGMQTMAQALEALVHKGVIHLETAITMTTIAET